MPAPQPPLDVTIVRQQASHVFSVSSDAYLEDLCLAGGNGGYDIMGGWGYRYEAR